MRPNFQGLPWFECDGRERPSPSQGYLNLYHVNSDMLRRKWRQTPHIHRDHLLLAELIYLLHLKLAALYSSHLHLFLHFSFLTNASSLTVTMLSVGHLPGSAVSNSILPGASGTSPKLRY